MNVGRSSVISSSRVSSKQLCRGQVLKLVKHTLTHKRKKQDDDEAQPLKDRPWYDVRGSCGVGWRGVGWGWG